MNINLDKFFDAQKPVITVFGKTYEVDNDYKKVLAAQAMTDSLDKSEEGVRKFLGFALKGGDSAAGEILAHNMPFPFLEKLILAVTAAMTGESMENIEKAGRQAQNERFQGGAKKRV